jgi:hypothetical protein
MCHIPKNAKARARVQALVTLFLMPWLIFLVWCADNNWFMGEKEVKVADDGGEVYTPPI